MTDENNFVKLITLKSQNDLLLSHFLSTTRVIQLQDHLNSNLSKKSVITASYKMIKIDSLSRLHLLPCSKTWTDSSESHLCSRNLSLLLLKRHMSFSVALCDQWRRILSSSGGRGVWESVDRENLPGATNSKRSLYEEWPLLHNWFVRGLNL